MTFSGRNDRITMGVSFDNSAWVRVGGGTTVYRAEPRESKPEYVAADYEVTLVSGPDVLDHDEVRRCAHDAFCDAFGSH